MFFLPVLALSAFSTVLATSLEERATCDTYVVSGISGGFNERILANFSSATPGASASSFLSNIGFSISAYTIADDASFIDHQFESANVALGTGTLDLKVSAYSGSGAVKSAEVVTNAEFMYASVRTVLKSSSTPGVCEGNFFYSNKTESDQQETDWEILTSTTLMASDCLEPGIWATNQALVKGEDPTDTTIPFTFDPSESFHEYRIDWTSAATTFYIDGVQKARLTSNVPTVAGPWVWNAWSNGDPCWSNGPPTKDSVTQIRSIDIYMGYTSTVSGTVCNV